MPFISYAQNFEDAMLWRALKHVERGFYVDIGAQHPIIDSVSKGFYEKGWRGVHVEPVPAWAALLRTDRPDETVLEIAISDHPGTLQLNVIPDTGLSTTVGELAQRHHDRAGWDVKPILVPCLPLDAALSQLADRREVHWLKIDVEGAERDVLEGWAPESIRPWVLVVEATRPSSEELSFADWEPRVLAARYTFAYFDGLNRFYVAQEHDELMPAFNRPPNVFDDVVLSGTSTSVWCSGLNQRVERIQETIETLTRKDAEVCEKLRLQEHRYVEMAALADRLLDERADSQAHIMELAGQLDETRAKFGLSEQHAGGCLQLLRTAEAGRAVAETRASLEFANMRKEINAAVARATTAETQLLASNTQLRHLQTCYVGVLNSKSWKLTSPLRYGNLAFHWARYGAVAWLTLKPGTRPRRTARRILEALGLWERFRPAVVAMTARAGQSAASPAVAVREPQVQTVPAQQQLQQPQPQPQPQPLAEAGNLPAAAATLYGQLRQARRDHNQRAGLIDAHRY